jgi:hypothetical protein
MVIRAPSQEEMRQLRAQSKMQLYGQLLRGQAPCMHASVNVWYSISASETIGVLAFQALQVYQKDNNVSEEDHRQALGTLGFTVEQFNGMRRSDAAAGCPTPGCLAECVHRLCACPARLCLCWSLCAVRCGAACSFTKKEKRDAECVVCLDKAKEFVVMPCMHMCLCEDCSADFSQVRQSVSIHITPHIDDQPNAKCPICSSEARKVMRIFV